MNLLYLFSTWIFIWSILYIFKIVPYTPVFALWCGILVEFIFIIFMILRLESLSFILFFFIVTALFAKIIPLYIIHESVVLSSVYATLVLFCVYIGMVYLTGNVNDVLADYMNIIVNRKLSSAGQVYQKIFSS